MLALSVLSRLAMLICFTILVVGKSVEKRAALTFNKGKVTLTSDHGKNIELRPGNGGEVMINGPTVYGSSSSASCNSKRVGSIRFYGGKLQVCNGRRFITVGAKLGSHQNPARSCQEILKDDWSAQDGAYFLETGTSVSKVYCQMSQIPNCGKGFTMIMKINGHKTTFHYNSSYWGNKVAYNPSGGSTGKDYQETKLPTYWTLPLERLCLGMMAGSSLNWIRLDYKASSLYSLIADGRYRATSLGRNSWKSLISGSSLQRNCNKEGFNVKEFRQMARIGILANEQNDCNTPDSRIAFGGGGRSFCSTRDSNSCGNEATCGGDKGNKHTEAFGYIFAQ